MMAHEGETVAIWRKWQQREFVSHQQWALYGLAHMTHVVSAMQWGMIADGHAVEVLRWRCRPVDFADGWVIEVEAVEPLDA